MGEVLLDSLLLATGITLIMYTMHSLCVLLTVGLFLEWTCLIWHPLLVVSLYKDKLLIVIVKWICYCVHSLVTMFLPLDLVLTSYWQDGYRVNGIVDITNTQRDRILDGKLSIDYMTSFVYYYVYYLSL